MFSVVILIRRVATVQNLQLMLDQSFGGLLSQLATLATPCSRFCWKRLKRSLGLIILVRLQSHVRLRLLNFSLSAWRAIQTTTMMKGQLMVFIYLFQVKMPSLSTVIHGLLVFSIVTSTTDDSLVILQLKML